MTRMAEQAGQLMDYEADCHDNEAGEPPATQPGKYEKRDDKKERAENADRQIVDFGIRAV